MMKRYLIACLLLAAAWMSQAGERNQATLTNEEDTLSTPYFTISPTTVSKANCEVGDSVLASTFTVQQSNLTQPVTLEITGMNRNQWHLSKTQLTTDGEQFELWYCPTAAGNHRASLTADCTDAPASFSLISLSGTATNSTKPATLSVTPTSLPAFTATVGTTVQDTIYVTSAYTSGNVTIAVTSDDEQNMFIVSTAALPGNGTYPVIVTFRPTATGNYSATITFSTPGTTPVSVNVTGTATGTSSITTDYDTAFAFTSDALPYLAEHFDNAGDYRNRTLALEGWQNVVRAGYRAWWGYTDADTLSVAKVTGYIYQGAIPGDSLETWLITPALRYDVANQVFSFLVRGDLLNEEQLARLEVYFIDLENPADPYFEHITDLDSLIPARDSDLSGKWQPVAMDLSTLPNAPEAFAIGFRYIDYLGSNGCVYYLDDICWGTPTTALKPTEQAYRAEKFLVNGHFRIVRGGRHYDILGR